MSELSIHELQAEHVELLPERETLGALLISQEGASEANQAFTFASANVANVSQHVNVLSVASLNTLAF